MSFKDPNETLSLDAVVAIYQIKAYLHSLLELLLDGTFKHDTVFLIYFSLKTFLLVSIFCFHLIYLYLFLRRDVETYLEPIRTSIMEKLHCRCSTGFS